MAAPFYDAALAGLHLAAINAEMHDRHEVERLTEDVLPVFRHLELPTRVAQAGALRRQASRL